MSKKWTLVEAEISKKVVDGVPLVDLRPTATNPAFAGDKAVGVKKRRASRVQGRQRDRSSTVEDFDLEEDPTFLALSASDVAYAVHIAVQNIEYLFGSDNLAQDTYLRSLMDCAGYVPLAYVLQYPDLMYSAAPSDDVLKAVGTNSQLLEIDAVNETIRLRTKWEQYLLPNEKGGRGLSQRYIKDVPPLTSTATTPAGAQVSPPRPVASAPVALSAAAKEFVASPSSAVPAPAPAPAPAMAASPLRANAFEFAPKAPAGSA